MAEGKGNDCIIDCRIVREMINTGALEDSVASEDCGATVLFVGTVRNTSSRVEERGRAGEVVRLEYEAYVPMALNEMRKIVEEGLTSWPGARVSLHHRIGTLSLGDIAVAMAVATPHRGAAFDACRFIIEELKLRVPIWKKEIFSDGAEWVDPRP